MSFVLVRKKIEDYDSWRQKFEDHEKIRRDLGSTGRGHIFRNADDAGEVVILLQWGDLEKVRRRRKMAELTGFLGDTEVTFLEEAERLGATGKLSATG